MTSVSRYYLLLYVTSTVSLFTLYAIYIFIKTKKF